MVATSSAKLVREAMKNVGHTLLGLANPLGATRSKWATEANLDWQIHQAPVMWEHDGEYMTSGKRKVLFRDGETPVMLGVVSERYKPVQPADVLDFFGDICQKHGFVMELAGSAADSRLLWGMARTEHEITLKGGDKLFNYLTLLTANDGTKATTGFFTSFRLFCTNQLPLAFREKSAARITHAREFTVSGMKTAVEALGHEWKDFGEVVQQLSTTPVDQQTTIEYFQMVNDPKIEKLLPSYDLGGNSIPLRMLTTYQDGPGQDECRGTAWGLVNGVTRFLDHDSRLAVAEK
jgi:phage/plasmid-like protein (TIGR03299 family)